MKAEINNENKAKFFALYYGESVLMSKHYESPIPNIGASIDYLSADDYISFYLQLKPLSSISDEDAIEVSKIVKLVYPNEMDSNLQNIKKSAIMYVRASSIITDYLRSKGYAVPWMGLSVEEMVEAGWIRLLDKTH